MALTTTQRPLAEVSAGLSRKTPIGAKLDTHQWQTEVPAALRESAFFSANVESVRALQEMQVGFQQILDLVRGSKGEVAMDRSGWIAKTQQMANRFGLRTTDPDKRGTLQDFGSERRLAEIYRQQIGQAQNRAYYLSGQDPDVLDGWPAQELVRVRASKIPRDWERRWAAAGGRVVNGRMVALKTDPVWTKISRFGRPYPPFDFNSGMGLEEIDREEAEAMGLIAPGETIEPSVARDQEELEASARGLSPEMKQALLKTFGDSVELVDDIVKWKGTKPPLPVLPIPPEAPPAPKVTPNPEPTQDPVTTDAPRLQPAGTPVSPAAQIRTRTKKDERRFRDTLVTIDAVHGDGALVPVPFHHKVARGAAGTYWSSLTRAASVTAKAGLSDLEGVLTHEVGHWIDHIGIPSTTKFASEDPKGPLVAWRAAVEKSDAYAGLLALPVDTAKRRQFREYSLRGREIFARAYAQFIAVESGHAAMLAQIAETVNGTAGYPKSWQWAEEDFAPIREEMKKAFVALGWMK